MTLPYRTVLFDMDGTIVESGEGIIRTVEETLRTFGWRTLSPEELRRFVGPPSHDSYRNIAGMDEALARRAADWHRARYREENWRLARLFPGMWELLADLRRAGAHTALATTKPRPALESMLDAFALRDLLDFTASSRADGTGGEKPALIARCLTALGETDKSRTVMIGDTRFDAAGARDAGVPFLGVLYGYGTRAEMEREGARRFVQTVAELRAALL